MIVAPTSGFVLSTDLSTDASRSSDTVMSTEDESFDALVSVWSTVIVAVFVIVLPPWPASTVAVIVSVADCPAVSVPTVHVVGVYVP